MGAAGWCIPGVVELNGGEECLGIHPNQELTNALPARPGVLTPPPSALATSQTAQRDVGGAIASMCCTYGVVLPGTVGQLTSPNTHLPPYGTSTDGLYR